MRRSERGELLVDFLHRRLQVSTSQAMEAQLQKIAALPQKDKVVIPSYSPLSHSSSLTFPPTDGCLPVAPLVDAELVQLALTRSLPLPRCRPTRRLPSDRRSPDSHRVRRQPQIDCGSGEEEGGYGYELAQDAAEGYHFRGAGESRSPATGCRAGQSAHAGVAASAQVCSLREQYAELLENDEEYSEAAKVLMGIPLESGGR